VQRVLPFCTPLWPAGHLPLKGGDRLPRLLSPSFTVAVSMLKQAVGIISPPEGEMAGRPEGGVNKRHPSPLSRMSHSSYLTPLTKAMSALVSSTSRSARITGKFSGSSAVMASSTDTS